MTRLALLFALLAFGGQLRAQHHVVQEIIDDVNLDSMLLWCEMITGDVPITVNGVTDTVFSRHSNAPGNEVSFQWLAHKLASYGLCANH